MAHPKIELGKPQAHPTKISEHIHNPFPICFKTEKLIAFFIPSIHIYTFFNVSFSDAKSVGDKLKLEKKLCTVGF
jgi:hypothetical protein